MRIILFNRVKFSFSVAFFCLCTLILLCSVTVRAEPTITQSSKSEIPGENEQPRLAPVNNLDWVEKQHMTPNQKALVAKYCCGAYIEPKRNYQDANQDPDQAPLRVNALNTAAQSDSVALLEGDVNISQGYRQLRSDSALVDQANRTITLTGNVSFREPNMLLIGNYALLDLDSEEVQIKNATYVLHQASIRGDAKVLRRKSDGIIIIKDSSFTGCEPSVNSWELQTSEISLDQTSGFATIKNARLDFAKIPIFYFPYVKFPISERRSSGLLFPSISRDQENGLDFSQPIYLNLASNYDATITPRYIQHRGTGVETKFRHLNSWSKSQLAASFLGKDKGGNNKYQKDPTTGLYPNQGQDRYLISLKHQGNFAQSWSSVIDINNVSDKNYFSDIGQMTGEQVNPIYLRRMGSLGYQTDHWDFSIRSLDYQSITLRLDDPYRDASEVTHNGNFRYSNSVTAKIRNQHTEFRHDNQSLISGGRTSLDYRLGLYKRWSWGYVKPNLGLKYLGYKLNLAEPNKNDNSSITVPTLSLDSGIIFEKTSTLFSGYKQTLEPRLFYVKSKFRDQQSLPDFDTKEISPSFAQLFSDSRYVGGDRISDDHRLTLGLSTSLIDKKNGHERFRANIAQAIYFDDRRVSLSESLPDNSKLERKKSDLAFELSFRINDQWHLNNEAVYNNQDNYWEKGAASLYYRNEDKLFNLSYRYSSLDTKIYSNLEAQERVEQFDMSFYVPIWNDFNWVGRWHHDFTNHRELELFSGFEYNNCCWRAGLVVRRWLDRRDLRYNPEQDLELRNGVFFQIQFRGLAGTNGRVASILKKGIFGYEPLEQF